MRCKLITNIVGGIYVQCTKPNPAADGRAWMDYLSISAGICLSQTTISNIFKRNNQPSLPTVNAICDACGITLAQFFTENDTANSPNAKSELDNSVATLNEDQREALAAFIKTIV